MSHSGEEPKTAMSHSGEEPKTAMSHSGEEPSDEPLGKADSGETCLPDELRTLFLFEALSDEQLATLCQNGHIQTFEPGPVCVEGEPATCFYVLIDGELVMSKRSAGVDLDTSRTSQRGVYCGAWSAYVPGEQHVYEASVRVTRPSRFFVLDANAFADFMKTEFPMAVHLVEGHKVGGLRQRQIVGQREKLLALGQLTAGLTHQLNNPAAATARAAADLRGRVSKMRNKLAMLADGKFTPEAMRALVSIQDEVAEQVAKAKPLELTALETSDREDQIGDWLEDHGISDAWDYAPTFVEAGLDIDWLERVSATAEEADATFELPTAIGWLKYTIDTEELMKEILEASKRISELLAGAKQYSQMDRAPYQAADIHVVAAQHADDVRRPDRQGQQSQTRQGIRQVVARIALLPRRSEPGLDEHHRQCDPGNGRQRHVDGPDHARKRRHGPGGDLR